MTCRMALRPGGARRGPAGPRPRGLAMIASAVLAFPDARVHCCHITNRCRPPLNHWTLLATHPPQSYMSGSGWGTDSRYTPPTTAARVVHTAARPLTRRRPRHPRAEREVQGAGAAAGRGARPRIAVDDPTRRRRWRRDRARELLDALVEVSRRRRRSRSRRRRRLPGR